MCKVVYDMTYPAYSVFFFTEPSSNFSEISIGGDGGAFFSDFTTWSQTEGPIRHIVMQCYQQYVGSIQITYGDVQGPHNGLAGRTGTKTLLKVTLDSWETIKGVDAWGDSVVNGIQFITNTGYRNLCGQKDGNFISVRNQELSYISGKSGNIIDKISFYWKGMNNFISFFCWVTNLHTDNVQQIFFP